MNISDLFGKPNMSLGQMIGGLAASVLFIVAGTMWIARGGSQIAGWLSIFSAASLLSHVWRSYRRLKKSSSQHTVRTGGRIILPATNNCPPPKFGGL